MLIVVAVIIRITGDAVIRLDGFIVVTWRRSITIRCWGSRGGTRNRSSVSRESYRRTEARNALGRGSSSASSCKGTTSQAPVLRPRCGGGSKVSILM